MIKSYQPCQLEACIALFIKAFNGPPWYNRWTEETAERYLRELAECRRFCGFTFWEGSRLIGAVFARAKTYYSGDELYIDEFFIDPGHQHMGYGQKLMQAVEQYALENAVLSITLLTGKEKPSFGFFERCGFQYLDSLGFMHKRL